MGTPLAESRVGPRTASMVYQYGALVQLKKGWPDLYNRFVSLHPEVNIYS